MALSDRIKALIGEMKYADFGAQVGKSSRTVQRWASGETVPQGKDLQVIADTFNVDLNWLLSGQGRPYVYDNVEEKEPDRIATDAVSGQGSVEARAGKIPIDRLEPSEFYLVGIAGGVAATNARGVVFDRIVSVYPFKRSWLRELGGTSDERLAHFRLLMISGDSMEPLISHGELVLVDSNDDSRERIVNDGIYAIRTDDGDIIAKRLYVMGNALIIMSDNTKYKTYAKILNDISVLDIVIGRVVWVGKELV